MTASSSNRFHAIGSDSSFAFSISVSVLNLPSAKAFTVEVRFSSVSAGLSLNSICARGWDGLHALPRPAETLRSTIWSQELSDFGPPGPGHFEDEEIPSVRSRSTQRASHENDQVSVTAKVASNTCLPLSLPGVNSKYMRLV